MSANKTRTSPRRPKPYTFQISWRDAVEAAMRLRTDHKGRRYVNRFSTAAAIEHFVLLLSFVILGITGFAQTFYNTALGSHTLELFGGIDSLRQVHHAFAFILGISVGYHLLNYANDLIVYRHSGGMWFDHADWSLLFRLGRSKKPTEFGRYTFAEKISYWATAFAILTLGASGLAQLFPIWVSEVLPGRAVPAAKLTHFWMAVLLAAVVLVWHAYDVLIRKVNLSILTGNMSIKDMEEDHPLELHYLEAAAGAVNSPDWPLILEIAREDEPPILEKKTESKPAVEARREATAPQETPKNTEPVEGQKDEAASQDSVEG